MVVALSTGQELGLAAVAGVFILFALVSAFLLPKRDPNFPGRGLKLFVLVTVLFFAGMISAIAVLARESEEEGGHEAEPPAQTETQTGTGETQTETTTGTQETEPAVEGDPAAGEGVFASAACGGCHTLQAAGAAGTIGPNLDEAKPAYDLIVERVTNGKSPMPSFKDQLSEQQIKDVAAFVFTSTR